MLVTLLVSLLVFMLVVLFHEGGHFMAAKAVGIKVNEFSIGMGPALFQRQRGETTYSLRAVPLGGYTAMEGEEEESDDPRSFQAAKPWQRFLTILAGPLMNLLIAYLCFALYLGITGFPTTRIAGFSASSPMKEAGMEVGDELLSFNGAPIKDFDDLKKKLNDNGLEEILLSYRTAGGEMKEARVKPVEDNGEFYLGFYADREREGGRALLEAFTVTGQTYLALFKVLGGLFTGSVPLNAVSGPVGVIKIIGDAAHEGFSQAVYLTGYISLNLAFFNLLPIPALDGSHLLFIIIEKIRGKKMKAETEQKIMTVGFCLLIGLILLVSAKDIWTLAKGGWQ